MHRVPVFRTAYFPEPKRYSLQRDGGRGFGTLSPFTSSTLSIASSAAGGGMAAGLPVSGDAFDGFAEGTDEAAPGFA